MSTFEQFLFYQTNEKFYLDPCLPDRSPVSGNHLCLVIDRFSGEISVSARSLLPYAVAYKLVYGIFGSLETLICRYLVLITSRKLAAVINGESIHAVESTEIIPYIPVDQSSKPPEEIRENQIYYQMMQTFLEQKYFYYSNTYDITHTLQNLQNTDADFRRISLFQRADQRFVWNRFMMREFSGVDKIDQFIVPIIFGFCGSIKHKINGCQFQLTLISRRDSRRAGVRLFSRGLDSQGNVSNFVEIEQILEFEPFLASLVQIRGSIPLFWTQTPNLERLPWPKIRTDHDHTTAFRLHLQDLVKLYGNRLCFLSLISKSGREKQLAQAFEHLCTNAVKNDDAFQLVFIAFDFHEECRNMNWSKLGELIEKLTSTIDSYGYFCYNKSILMDASEICRQTGTFRTNCIDCLDRTNVVQSLIAKKSLNFQLKRLLVLSATDDISNYDDFSVAFNSLWADNGDFLSIHYAGTGALKADFTRTGKRTKLGLFNDGVNSGIRYYINNFIDGFKQDALDFCLGSCAIDENVTMKNVNYAVHQAVKKVDKKLNEWEWRHYVGILLVFVSCMLLLSVMVSSDSTFCLAWGIICIMVLAYAYYAGEQIVCKPKLKID